MVRFILREEGLYTWNRIPKWILACLGTDWFHRTINFVGYADGNEGFWTSTRPGGYGNNDIWTSRRVDGKWSDTKNLGPNVNGPWSEHASIPTTDSQSLYITSDRPGGFGGDYTYITQRSADGKWGPLTNLGPLVNGPGDDRCPAWTPDLKIFLFDSVRQGRLGARDIWWVYFKNVKGYPKM